MDEARMTKSECKMALEAMKEQMRNLTKQYVGSTECRIKQEDYTWLEHDAINNNEKVIALARAMKKMATQMYDAKE